MREPAVYLVSIGKVQIGLMEAIAGAVEATFRISCRLGPVLSEPAHAYDPVRRQYHIGKVLRGVRRLGIREAQRLLGLVDKDCYSPGLNFVFGQAMLGGRDAVVALPRLRPEFYGEPKDEALFTERAVKEAVHELGHTYGLSHCPYSLCVMYFSNTLQDTDHKARSFCLKCKTLLDVALG